MQLSGAIKATAFVHTRISWNTISHELIDGFVTERNEMTQVKCALTKRQITESMMAKIHDEIGNSRIPQPYSAHRKCTLKAQSPWVRVQLKDIADYLGYTSSSVFGRAVLRRRRSWEKWEAGLRRRPLLYPLAPRPAGRERLSRSDNLGGKLVEALRTDSVFDLWEIRWPTITDIFLDSTRDCVTLKLLTSFCSPFIAYANWRTKMIVLYSSVRNFEFICACFLTRIRSPFFHSRGTQFQAFQMHLRASSSFRFSVQVKWPSRYGHANGTHNMFELSINSGSCQNSVMSLMSRTTRGY